MPRDTSNLPSKIYVLLVQGNWPIYSEPDEVHAMSRFEHLEGEFGVGKVRCWKIEVGQKLELTLKRTPDSLIPLDQEENSQGVGRV